LLLLGSLYFPDEILHVSTQVVNAILRMQLHVGKDECKLK
jgi:hypothetical protein